MADKRTLKVYDAKCRDYAEAFRRSEADAQLLAFMAMVPKGGHVLDLGCGPAFASAHMRDAGFICDPVDGSEGMVKIARELHGLDARLLMFDQIDMVDAYDGIWANFSLLHAKREDLPRHLAALSNALRTDGAFHIGLKTGQGEARDSIDRFYTYWEEDTLQAMLADVGLTVTGVDHGSGKGLAGTLDSWVVIRARKNG